MKYELGKIIGRLHSCDCTDYNHGQCYNCLNGAHSICGAAQKGKPICNRRVNDERLGLTLEFRSKEENTKPKAIVGITDGSESCECHHCIGANGLTLDGVPLDLAKMILCGFCGNKRCPKAEDHRYKCNDSNEPNQVGVFENDN